MKRTYLIFIMLLFLPMLFEMSNSSAYASKAKNTSPVQSQDSNGFDEAKAYRLLYDNQVKSNDAILKTIFYALGGLASAIILVFASNWWFNEKKVSDIRSGINAQINDARNAALSEVEAKINALAADKTEQINTLQLKFQEQISASIAELTAKNTEFHEKIRAEIKEDNKSLLNNYQTQLESFNNSYRQEITTMSEDIKSRTDNINNKINNTEQLLKTTISRRIDMVKRDIARNEYYLWKTKGVMANALTALTEELELLLKHPSDNRNYDFYLDDISQTLDEISVLDPSSKEETIEIVKRVPDKFNLKKKEVLRKLENIKTQKE